MTLECTYVQRVIGALYTNALDDDDDKMCRLSTVYNRSA